MTSKLTLKKRQQTQRGPGTMTDTEISETELSIHELIHLWSNIF